MTNNEEQLIDVRLEDFEKLEKEHIPNLVAVDPRKVEAALGGVVEKGAFD